MDHEPAATPKKLNELAAELDGIAEQLRARRFSPDTPGQVDPVDIARSLLSLRRSRQRHFPADLFAEPCWDILLSLYIASAEQRAVPLQEVVRQGNAPTTTVVRQLTRLEEAGLVRRTEVPGVKRRVQVEITAAAAANMAELLAAGLMS